jgi:hypothetical protein
VEGFRGKPLKTNFINSLGMLHEPQVSLTVPGFDTSYFLKGLLERPSIIEDGAIRISESIPGLQGDEFHMVVEVFPKEFKKLLKKKRRGDYRGAGIVTKSPLLINLRTTSEPRGSVNQCDLIAFCPEP